MNKTRLLIALLGALAAPAWATEYHNGDHARPVLHADEVAIGHPAQMTAVDRTISVSVSDAADGSMAFDATEILVRKGETIRFVLSNDGSENHEFVMGTQEEITGHLDEMQSAADMRHDAPFAVRVRPGETGELLWTFSNEGSFVFASLIPGQYEAGMHGRLTVE